MIRPPHAIRTLALAGAGLSATLAAHGQVQAQTRTQTETQPATQLAPVVVTGLAPSVFPSYAVKQAVVGPLGQKHLLDTPYSIGAIPISLAQNQQLRSVTEAFAFIPSVQGVNIRPQTRGMQAGVVQNTRIDGMNIAATTDYPIEQFEEIDVLSGLAGALYGPASPAGTFDYVLKRPTEQPLREFTFGYESNRSLTEHADLGGHFGTGGMFGYRLNLLNQNGESWADGSRLRRDLASLAFDVAFTRDTRLETNFSTYQYLDTGFPGTFALAKNMPFPSAPNPTRAGLGQSWAGDNNVTNIIGATLKHDFGSDWHVSAGLLRETSDRASTVPTYTLTNPAGKYTATTATTTYSLDQIVSNTLALNGRLNLGGTTHDVFVSNTGFYWNRYTPYKTGAITLGTGNLNDPATFAQPRLPDFSNRYRSVNTFQQSINAGDTVTFDPRWSALVAVSESWIHAENYNKAGAITSKYSASGVSPTASLMFKPWGNQTAYVTYANSLQQGDIAPSGTLNAGDELAPYRSNEWEIGYKAQVGGTLLGAALYRIERPYALVQRNNVFAAQGQQVNRGLELTATGAVTHDINIYAGLSLLDPHLYNASAGVPNGTQILGLSRVTFDALVDYSVPAVPGLGFNVDVNYASRRPGNYSNTDWVSGYTVLNLGARYRAKLAGKCVTLRFAVDNATNRAYWANVTPAGQNGYTGTDSGTAVLGAPRTVRASLQIDL